MKLHFPNSEQQTECWVDRGPKIEKYMGGRFRLCIDLWDNMEGQHSEALSSNEKTRTDYWKARGQGLLSGERSGEEA